MEGLDYLAAEDSSPADVEHPLDKEAAALQSADAELERRDQIVVPALLGVMAVGLTSGVPLMFGAAVLGLAAYGLRSRGGDLERLMRTSASSKSSTLQSAKRQLALARINRLNQQADDLTVLGAIPKHGTVFVDNLADITGLDQQRVTMSLNRLSSKGLIERSNLSLLPSPSDRTPPSGGGPHLSLVPSGKDSD